MFSCFYPSFQLLWSKLEADIFPDRNASPSRQSAPVHISFVEVTAKKGVSCCNSHLVSLNREGRRLKKSQEPRVSVLVDVIRHQMRWPVFLPPITSCVALVPLEQKCHICLQVSS